jgi:hypothetical protein
MGTELVIRLAMNSSIRFHQFRPGSRSIRHDYGFTFPSKEKNVAIILQDKTLMQYQAFFALRILISLGTCPIASRLEFTIVPSERFSLVTNMGHWYPYGCLRRRCGMHSFKICRKLHRTFDVLITNISCLLSGPHLRGAQIDLLPGLVGVELG